MKELFTFNLNSYHFKTQKTIIVYKSGINENKHWLFELVIKYIVSIIITMLQL